jgi:hypothetical protein
MRFAMSWKMHFIFSLNAREIPIIETFYTNTFKIYIELKQEKLKKILNPSTPEQIKTVTSFTKIYIQDSH